MTSYEKPTKDSEVNCDKCFDTGVRINKGEIVVCDCAKGQSEEGRKYYREIMIKRRMNAERENQKRLYPSLVIKYQCELCHDIRFVTDKDGQVIPCKCQRDVRLKAREQIYLKLCNIPDARPEWTLANFQNRAGCEGMLQAANDMVSGALLWLTIMSQSGYGKTHLLVGICREFLKQGKSARYIFVPDLINELKQGFDEQGANSYQAKMDFFKNVGLLAIDDLGTENSTPWVREQLDSIIDYRYVNKKPLIITSNRSLDALMPRVASRVSRMEVIDKLGRTVIPKGSKYSDYIRQTK